MSFERATAKVSIGSLDDTGLSVKAQYNPKELQIDRSVQWSPHDKQNADGLQLEFTGGQGRELSLELLFDAYDDPTNNTDVAGAIETLNKLAAVRNPTSSTDDMRRPHHCVVSWGTMVDKFQCVITSISTKYTMMSSDGKPLRATVTIKVKEASRVMMSKDSAKNAPDAGKKKGK